MRNEKGTEYRSDRFICHMCWNSGFFVMEFKNKVWEKVYKEAGWLERFQLKFIYFL